MKADIVTGQFVRIAQTPATVADRIIARVIDYVIIIIYIMFLMLLASFYSMIENPLDHNEIFDVVSTILVYALILPIPFYSFIFEVFCNGQTIGKMVRKTRVVNADGSQPRIGQLFLRWLLLIVDESMGLIGIIFIMFNRNSQRLGDMAAGTFVIRMQDYRQLKVTLNDFQYASPDYRPVYPQAANLSIGQAEVIRKALQTGAEYNEEQIARLVPKVEKSLGIQHREPSGVSFLLTVLHDYQYYALELV